MTSPKKTWWYAVGQNKLGPCSGSELLDLVAQGKLFPDTLVWKEGMPNWVPASRIKGLWQKLPSTPPAVPPLPSSEPSHEASSGTSTPISPSMRQQQEQQFGGFTPPPAPQASAWPEEDDSYEEELPPREEMTFKKAVERCLKKYFDFSGRAGRAEYWYFVLFIYVIAFILGAILGILSVDESTFDRIVGIYQLVIVLPHLAAVTRRLHDTGRSGWWILIALTIIGIFVLIYWLIQAGDDNANEYGYPE